MPRSLPLYITSSLFPVLCVYFYFFFLLSCVVESSLFIFYFIHSCIMSYGSTAFLCIVIHTLCTAEGLFRCIDTTVYMRLFFLSFLSRPDLRSSSVNLVYTLADMVQAVEEKKIPQFHITFFTTSDDFSNIILCFFSTIAEFI